MVSVFLPECDTDMKTPFTAGDDVKMNPKVSFNILEKTMNRTFFIIYLFNNLLLPLPLPLPLPILFPFPFPFPFPLPLSPSPSKILYMAVPIF